MLKVIQRGMAAIVRFKRHRFEQVFQQFNGFLVADGAALRRSPRSTTTGDFRANVAAHRNTVELPQT
ncbi:hypothetical protein [Paraburkholderia youngii]|uniref:hypothetical protein n=1 Tax=Paraburkholderia youngii TaxID=2782701 RepID=UPI001592BA77|nr:hypothetical protein [Paraburkholderia youngii]